MDKHVCTEDCVLITYNTSTSKFCRIKSDFMKPTNPGYTTAIKFFLMQDGIFGIIAVQNKDKYFFMFLLKIIC